MRFVALCACVLAIGCTDDWIYFGDDPTTVSIPPQTARVAGDRITVGASANNCTRQEPIDTDVPTLDMPAPFSATVDRSLVA